MDKTTETLRGLVSFGCARLVALAHAKVNRHSQKRTDGDYSRQSCFIVMSTPKASLSGAMGIKASHHGKTGQRWAMRPHYGVESVLKPVSHLVRACSGRAGSIPCPCSSTRTPPRNAESNLTKGAQSRDNHSLTSFSPSCPFSPSPGVFPLADHCTSTPSTSSQLNLPF